MLETQATYAYTTSVTSCCLCIMTTITKQRITLFINPSVVKHAKAQAIVEDLTLTDLVEKALIKYLPEETVVKKAPVSFDYNASSSESIS